jgi:hypothetical protein
MEVSSFANWLIVAAYKSVGSLRAGSVDQRGPARKAATTPNGLLCLACAPIFGSAQLESTNERLWDMPHGASRCHLGAQDGLQVFRVADDSLAQSDKSFDLFICDSPIAAS